MGLSEAAPTLYEAGCRTFFVAQAKEGAALRDILSAVDQAAVIYVMNGYLDGTSGFFQNHTLRPCLGSLEEIDAWTSAGGGPAGLHVDTGFNRLGLPLADLSTLPESFRPSLLMSHLACHEPEHPMNARQLAAFAATRQHFPDVPASLANSAGALIGADYHHDMIRVGIGLYGGSPTKDGTTAGRAVTTLRAPVLQVRTVKPGESIGYGATFIPAAEMRIAALGIGYADGFPRLWGAATRTRISPMSPLATRSARSSAVFQWTCWPWIFPVWTQIFNVATWPRYSAPSSP